MTNLRVGFGYDVHQLVEGRPLMLGGVMIPNDRGFLGHSDADVLLHAICDALLGGAALGDIGHHFPNNDPTYKDIPSLLLLKKTTDLLKAANFVIVNIDATVVLEDPKIGPFVPEMKIRIAAETGVPADCLSIKATTSEGLGFVGAANGCVAFATALIEKSDA